jgi:transcriptional regulator with XRE-family HTH domain
MNAMPQDLCKIFIQNVNARLEELGWTRSEFASQMGVTRAFITNYLNGHRRPGLDVVAKWAEALDVQPAQLVSKQKFAKS